MGRTDVYEMGRSVPGGGDRYARRAAWYDVRSWSKRKMIIVGGAIVAILLVIIVPVAVTQSDKSKKGYPAYKPLQYSLSEDYSGTGFFDKFDYFDGFDPTSGHVHYVPRARAQGLNLTSATNDAAVLKVDTTVGPGDQPDASTGRFSVRVTSKNQYNDGLFLFDIQHSPYGCGTWPAVWLTDPSNWPDHGEIDVMEATNKGINGNQMTLHTSDGCSMSSITRKMTGDALKTNCDSSGDENTGCGVEGSPSSFGEKFNQGGGGVMALEWRSEGIRMWQFARGNIPDDVLSATSSSSSTKRADANVTGPDPSNWGKALADFPSTDCSIGSHFKNQSIVVNIDLCGSLGGAKYASSGCPSNCTDFVSNNPSAFDTAFWKFGSFKVFQAK